VIINPVQFRKLQARNQIMSKESPRWMIVTWGFCIGLAGGIAPEALAQCPTCGPVYSGSGSNCGHCGLIPTPIFDKLYIKKHCVPTICPGSCYGHFQTKWTPWPAACPSWQAGVVGYDPNLVHYHPAAGTRKDLPPQHKIPTTTDSGSDHSPPQNRMPPPRIVPPQEDGPQPNSVPAVPKSKGL
jgi:hypothetical protein